MTHAQIRWVTWTTGPRQTTLEAHVVGDSIEETLCMMPMPVHFFPASLALPPCGICSSRVIERLRLTQGM